MPTEQCLVVAPNEAHIWLFSQMASAPQIDYSVQLLSPDELERANKYIVSHARDRYITRRATLRKLLARYTQQLPESLEITYGTYGKPKLLHSDLHFNVSHSGDTAIIGISTQRIGVDIEATRSLADLRLVAKHHFSDMEQQHLCALPPEEHVLAFYRCWTRKEAVIKLIGTGLSLPLASFAVSLHDEPHPSMTYLGDLPHPESHLRALDLGKGFVGAIATKTPLSGLKIKTIVQ